MLPMVRLLPVFLLLVAVSGCSLVRRELGQLTGSTETRLADAVVIERDEWGVPHVHGRSDAAVLFGLAFAMAEDNYWQIEEDMLFALGWASHYYGERALAHDVMRVSFGVEARARSEYEAEPPERRVLWDAFAHGLNHFLRSHPEVPRRLLAHYEPWMLFARAAWFGPATMTDTVASGSLTAAAGVSEVGAARVAGRSWGWAIPAAASATGEPLLLTALDGPWFGTGQLYEAELGSDAGWHVAGVFELGLPLLRAGHNERSAWLEAAAGVPAMRLQRLVFDHPTDSLLFRSSGEWERATPREDTLSVNTPEGVTRRVVHALDTPYGPVVRRAADTAFAAQLAEHVLEGALQHALAVGRATSLEAFRSALSATARARRNVLYVDADGTLAVWIDGAEQKDAAPGGLQIGRRMSPVPSPDGGWTVASLEQAAFDATASEARSRITALVDEWELVGASNPRRAFALDSAVSALREWDLRFDTTSAAALLYALWQEEYARAGRVSGGPASFLALETALARSAGNQPVGSTWGDLQRLQRRHTSGVQAFADSLPSLPLGAAPAWTDAPFSVTSQRGLGWRRYAAAGRAWTAVTRLAMPPVTRSVVPFGQSAVAGSAHFEDQAPLFARGELKPRWFGPELSVPHVRERYHPGRRARVLQQ